MPAWAGTSTVADGAACDLSDATVVAATDRSEERVNFNTDQRVGRSAGLRVRQFTEAA
jgi:hypothetical protein